MIRRMLLAVALAGIAVGAHGQLTGSIKSGTAPIEVPEGISTGDAARIVSDDFALCIVQRHRGQVLKTLAGPPDAAHDYKFLPRLMDADCFNGSSSMGRAYGVTDVQFNTNPVAFRGALSKALVRNDYKRRAATFGATPIDSAGDNGAVHQFADCVARAAPDDTRKLVLASAGSSAERAAIGAIKPQLDKCTPQNSQMSFSKDNLVGYLAEAYYREADAAMPKKAD